MSLSDQQIHSLLVALSETHAQEIDCEQFLERMAQYVELRVAEQSLPDGFARVEEHERLCANCREECQALVELVRSES